MAESIISNSNIVDEVKSYFKEQLVNFHKITCFRGDE